MSVFLKKFFEKKYVINILIHKNFLLKIIFIYYPINSSKMYVKILNVMKDYNLR